MLKRPKFKEAYYTSEKAKGKKLNKAEGERGDYVTWGLGLGRGFPGSKVSATVAYIVQKLCLCVCS